jgi:hypothetical protein
MRAADRGEYRQAAGAFAEVVMVLKCKADRQRASDAGRASGLGFDALARANLGPHGALSLKVMPARRFPPP